MQAHGQGAKWGVARRTTPATFSSERGDQVLHKLKEFFTGHKFDPATDYQLYKGLKTKWFDLNRAGEGEPVNFSAFRSFCDRHGHISNAQSQRLGTPPPRCGAAACEARASLRLRARPPRVQFST